MISENAAMEQAQAALATQAERVKLLEGQVRRLEAENKALRIAVVDQTPTLQELRRSLAETENEREREVFLMLITEVVRSSINPPLHDE